MNTPKLLTSNVTIDDIHGIMNATMEAITKYGNA